MPYGFGLILRLFIFIIIIIIVFTIITIIIIIVPFLQAPWYDLHDWLGIINQLSIYLSLCLSVSAMMTQIQQLFLEGRCLWAPSQTFASNAFSHHKKITAMCTVHCMYIANQFPHIDTLKEQVEKDIAETISHTNQAAETISHINQAKLTNKPSAPKERCATYSVRNLEMLSLEQAEKRLNLTASVQV